MSCLHTVEQQKTLERLAGALSLRGWKDFEVSLDCDELRIEMHGGRAACTVIMLPHEPAFQAHFVFAATFVHAVSFHIGEGAARPAAMAATKFFRGAGEAAEWLLTFLDAGQV